MKKINISEKVKNYWVFEELKKRNYKIELKQENNETIVKVVNNIYKNAEATFKIKWFDDDFLKMFVIYDEEENITEYLEFTQTLDECINGCLYYFYTRY